MALVYLGGRPIYSKSKNIQSDVMPLTPFGPLVITLHRPALITPLGKGTVNVVSLVCRALQYWNAPGYPGTSRWYSTA